MLRTLPLALSFAAAVSSLPVAVSAQDGPEVVLDGDASSGAVAANVASGDANQQANVGVLASGNSAFTLGAVAQHLVSPELRPTTSARAAIADGAFAGSAGWLAANLSAGVGNQQANVATVTVGLTGQLATAAMLSQSRAPTAETASEQSEAAPNAFETQIGEGAFEGASGLVQVNLAAGDGNTSGNVFALAVPGE